MVRSVGGHRFRQDADRVAALVRAIPSNTVLALVDRAHRSDLLPHVVNLSLQHLSDPLQLVDIVLVVGR